MVRFLFRKTEESKVTQIINEIKKFKKKKSKLKPEISLLVVTPIGIAAKSLSVSKPKLNVEDNYIGTYLKKTWFHRD